MKPEGKAEYGWLSISRWSKYCLINEWSGLILTVIQRSKDFIGAVDLVAALLEKSRKSYLHFCL